VDEVHLAQVGLTWVACDPRTMLDGGSRMRVTLDPESRQESDAVRVWLGERVPRAEADRCHDPVYGDLLN